MYQKTDFLSEQAKCIREKVFLQEQGFQEEFDAIDSRAIHIVIYDGAIPVAVCRYYKGDSIKEYHIGRVAVLKQYRKKQFGYDMMQLVEKMIRYEGGKRVILSAQLQAVEFYKKCGYQEFGEVYLEESCPHIQMEKRFE